MVALVGIEPTLLAELDFESSASTSSATEPKNSPLPPPGDFPAPGMRAFPAPDRGREGFC